MWYGLSFEIDDINNDNDGCGYDCDEDDDEEEGNEEEEEDDDDGGE